MLTLAFSILIWAHLPLCHGKDQLELLNPTNSVLQKQLQQGEVWTFSAQAPAKEGLPANILLTLTTLNENGDADLFCLPEKLANAADGHPSALFSVWKSAKSQGQDLVFVSIHHDLYPLALDPSGQANLRCTVMGFSKLGSEAEISLEADYSGRLLAASERKALTTLFDKCCNLGQQQVGCLNWIQNKDKALDIFCHRREGVCDADGHLLTLDLKKYGLECSFPLEAIQELKYLRTLDMSMNHLKGNIEAILVGLGASLPDLTIIDFSLNDLKGSLDSSTAARAAVCNMTHGQGALKLLNLESNFIKGPLPSCLLDAKSNLKEIILGGSYLNGQVPEIALESSIQILRLDNTGLTGTVPEVIGELQSLAVLDLSDNFLTGSIPANIGDCPQLRTLRLEANTLQGMIPNSIATSTSLSVVRLEVNELTNFPASFYLSNTSASSVLKVFDASRNKIEGEFPQFLATAPHLTVLNLADNKLTGSLPDQAGGFPEVAVLQLAANQFEGSLPKALGDSRLFNVQVGNVSISPLLDLTGNNLTGQLPSFLTNLPAGVVVPVLYFQGNALEMECFGDLAIKALVVQSGVSCSEDEIQSNHDSTPTAELDNSN